MGCHSTKDASLSQSNCISQQLVVINEFPVSETIYVRTLIPLMRIEVLDVTPFWTTAGYPHFCPICMKYLSHILITRCCSQLICHFCVLSIMNTAIEQSCPHCKTECLILEDSTEVNKVLD